MEGRYRVLGNFDLMLKMDSLFAGPEPLDTGARNGTPTSPAGQAYDLAARTGTPAPKQKKADLFLVILPWLALWFGLPISPLIGTLASLGALAFLLFAGFVRRLSTHEQIAGALVALIALGNAAGIPATLLTPLSYLAFGAHWLLSCLATPLTAVALFRVRGGETIGSFSPLKYFIDIMRCVYLKGSKFTELLPQLYSLLGFVIVTNTWAILSYRKKN